MLCIGNQAGSGQFRLRWQRPDGVTETIPASALRARNRRDYYSFGGAVVAMREGVPSTAAIRPTTYLFGDHLGSSSLATNASGAVVAETRYKPYGEIRWSSGALPTDFGYTGQRLEKAGYVGSLMDYKARAYSPALGRFVSADTIVPGAGNPQALNRFAYVFNSPLGFVDPSGHDPLDAAWEAAFRAAHGRDPNDSDRHDRLFSLLFCGRGDNCAWTDQDWGDYTKARAGLWSGANKWFVDDNRRDLASFVSRVNHLASYYSDDEAGEFVRAVGNIWAGVSYSLVPLAAEVDIRLNLDTMWTVNPPLNEGADGWAIDMREGPLDSPAHHYAMYFYMGYYNSGDGQIVLWWSDGGGGGRAYNSPDVALGKVALRHGANLASGKISMSEVASAMMFALDANGGLWPPNSPGAR